MCRVCVWECEWQYLAQSTPHLSLCSCVVTLNGRSLSSAPLFSSSSHNRWLTSAYYKLIICSEKLTCGQLISASRSRLARFGIYEIAGDTFSTKGLKKKRKAYSLLFFRRFLSISGIQRTTRWRRQSSRCCTWVKETIFLTCRHINFRLYISHSLCFYFTSFLLKSKWISTFAFRLAVPSSTWDETKMLSECDVFDAHRRCCARLRFHSITIAFNFHFSTYSNFSLWLLFKCHFEYKHKLTRETTKERWSSGMRWLKTASA